MKRKDLANFPPHIQANMLKAMSLTENPKAVDPEAMKAFLADNHEKYLKQPMRIGFTQSFPEDANSVIDEIVVNTECAGFPVSFKVRYGKVTFGPDNKTSCYGITTDRVEISHKLRMGGWGQHGYVDEGGTMEAAVSQMALKHGLMICAKICSWPFAKAIVDKPTAAHARHFKKEQTTN